jgi:hypothetical protein
MINTYAVPFTQSLVSLTSMAATSYSATASMVQAYVGQKVTALTA